MKHTPLTLCLALSACSASISQTEVLREQCNKTSIKYGDIVTVNEGFYAGVKMKAVEIGQYSIAVYIEGLSENISFKCGDLHKCLKSTSKKS